MGILFTYFDRNQFNSICIHIVGNTSNALCAIFGAMYELRSFYRNFKFENRKNKTFCMECNV